MEYHHIYVENVEFNLAVVIMRHYCANSSVNQYVGTDPHACMHTKAYVLLYPRERGPTTEYQPTPHCGLNFLLGPSMRPYVPARAVTIKWAWLRSLAMHDRSFVLKCGIKLTRLSSIAIWYVTF
jgi:hypothetical protein